MWRAEETAEHLLFDCKTLAQVRLTVFVLVSKDSDILQENTASCTYPRYCRLMDLPTKHEKLSLPQIGKISESCCQKPGLTALSDTKLAKSSA